MTRALVVIPHFFDPNGGGRHGSRCPDPLPRVRALAACLDGLHTSLGASQVAYDIASRVAPPANQREAVELDVAIVTTGEKHLLAALPVPPDLYRHVATDEDGWMLGFACRDVLRAGLGAYDWFLFIEDDLVLHDPLFLRKVAWFRGLAGEQRILQPNRFESDVRALAHKAYVDGDLPKRVLDPWRTTFDPDTLPALEGRVLGAPVRFVPAANPHGGCFFLSASQMERLAAQPWFALRDTSFVGPLESAVTLPLIRTFEVYKPAPENASFLELRHFGTGFLSLLRPRPEVRPAE